MADTISNNCVLEPTSGCWIPFQTVSDALIAQLWLCHAIPMATIDLVLAAVTNPAFVSSQITFASTKDIDVRVGEYRRTVASRRVMLNQCTTAGIPPVVLDCVLDAIVSDIPSLMSEVATRRHRSGVIQGGRAVLLSMSLVHRTWTSPAQERLRRRFVLHGDQDRLISYLRNPLCGPWIRELGLGYVYSRDSVRQQDQLAESLLSRVPNLRILAFGMISPLAGWFTRTLETLVHIERLSLFGRLSNSAFAQLCEILPALHNLSFLRISDYEDPGTDILQAVPLQSPPPSLKTVALSSQMGFPLSYPHLAWLLKPSGDFVLHYLILGFRVVLPAAAELWMSEIAQSCSYALRRLFIQLRFPRSVSHTHRGTHSLRDTLARSASLKSLHLVAHALDPTIELPTSLEEISFETQGLRSPPVVTDHGVELNDVHHDDEVHEFLSKQHLPRLRTVDLIVQSERSLYALQRAAREMVFPMTNRFCVDKKVQLVFRLERNVDDYLSALERDIFE